jgi:hypothetical protein
VEEDHTCSKGGNQSSSKANDIEIDFGEGGKGNTTHDGDEGDVDQSGRVLAEEQDLQQNGEGWHE